ncbi:MAG: hypothetical protein HY749_03850 [Gammaproteobacteria bacterium]|nr:hypothetical protein [Gammaproteobacteria bacterium]MBI5617233.1 hypothetical protein [Gammaproteobacteria bacterium]
MPSFEELRAKFEAEDERNAARLVAAGFDWKVTPRINHGIVPQHPLTTPPYPSFILKSGRTIKLCEVFQFYVYGGVLAGLPREQDSSVIEALDVAARVFPREGSQPLVLTPLLHEGVCGSGPEDDSWLNRWCKLSDVCTVGLFVSDTPARDEAMDGSAAVVIWFQNAYGVGFDARTVQQIEALEWERCASDFEL